MIKSQWKGRGGGTPSAFSKVDAMLSCNGRNPFPLAIASVTRGGPFPPALAIPAGICFFNPSAKKVCRMVQLEMFLNQITPAG